MQDYMQKMEATKKAVGMVKGKTVFKPKEGTPKVSVLLLLISRLKDILFRLSYGMKPRMMMAIFSTTTSKLQNQGNNPTFYPYSSYLPRWDAPPWGYLSIKEQEEIETQQRMKEYSKEKVNSGKNTVTNLFSRSFTSSEKFMVKREKLKSSTEQCQT